MRNKIISFLVLISIFSPILFFSNLAKADNPIGQIVQIETHFSDVAGKPRWVLILRDAESGKVSPYFFDFKQENFWIALSYGHSYRIISSDITFGKYAKIKNFCSLENNILSDKSMLVRITGKLTPSPKDFRCHTMKYQNMQFTIVPN